MGNSLPVNPNPNPPNPNSNLPPPPPPRFLRHSPIRATTEFDSRWENPLFHTISCKVIDGLAKLKIFYLSNSKGQIISPQISFITDRFKVYYDVESRDAFLYGWLDMGRFFSLQAMHKGKCGQIGVPVSVRICCSRERISVSCINKNQNSILTSVNLGTHFLFKYNFIKNREGDVALIAKLGDPFHKLELRSSIPSTGLPKATLTFRNGEVSVEKVVKEEATEKVLSVSGILITNILDGVGTAMFTNDDLNLKYFYKDNELTFIPRISLPSNALSFAFKRRFSPSDKLSFFYNFNTSDWNTVYKHTARKNLKFKAGYDSSAYGNLKWACVLVGDEWGRVKSLPFKMKLKLMLQVPQGINKSILFFRVKKRWDFDF